MTRREIIKEIIRMIREVKDETVLTDILNLTSTVHRHYIAGNWRS